MTYLIGAIPMIVLYMIIAWEIGNKNTAFQIHAQFFTLISIPLWVVVFIAKEHESCSSYEN